MIQRAWRSFDSIAVRLFVLFFVSMIVPVLIGGYLSYVKSARMIEDQVSRVAALTIQQASDKLNLMFKQLDDVSVLLASRKTIRDAVAGDPADDEYEVTRLNAEAKDLLISAIANSPEIVDIFILDVNRRNSVLSSNMAGFVDPWETDWYKAILAADGRAVWFGLSKISYLKGVETGIPVFGMGRTLKDRESGKVLGVIFMEVKGSMLTGAMADLQFGKTGHTFLVNYENAFMYHPDPSRYGHRSDLRLPERMEVQRESGGDMLVIPGMLDNGWRVVGVVPVRELVEGSLQIRNLTIWIALSSIAVAAVMGVYVAHRIGRPLVYLSKLMKRGEQGDLTVRSKYLGRTEIGQLGTSFNHMIARIDLLIRRIAEEEAEKKKAEIRALRHQINPHFLYNTLNSIRWLAKLQKTDDVDHAIAALVHLLEASLERSGPFIRMSEEFELLRKYVMIQQYRYSHRLSLDVRCPPRLEGMVMPRMLLQPLVENAIFHGIAPKDSGGSIRIRVREEGTDAVIEIEDDGIGIPPDKLPGLLDAGRNAKRRGMTGLGLSHVHQTLQLYYGPPYGVRVHSREGEGTLVELRLPIREEDAHVSGAVGR
ncbi:putative signal transduction protein with a C-terminal ATPase domain [Thermobacillus composti KWC4]|uniref:histidine kinase n=1 Tax=Thermobacillus composti (strain DSM 18247 / JCM 13945 / KWC4) TaxID=717605 RepID=L0ECZ8_THECK|nr:sensor histidine kinase [Thermobacillus composti]AGA57667.1 putative signal transduction protein with a C-terminal ATPase domain [Thermobacillus composti KWC4]